MRADPASVIAIAANLANRAHATCGQVRKVTGLPYIVHPHRVALMVEEAGGTPEQIAAAWAHDVLEDCPEFCAEAVEVLPPVVLALVRELTKAETSPGKRVEGAAFLAGLRAMSPAAKLVKLCDRLDNLRGVIASDDRAWICAYARETLDVVAVLTASDPAPGAAAERLAGMLRELATEWQAGGCKPLPQPTGRA